MVAILATLIAVGSISAYAVPKTQVLRVSDGAVHRASAARRGMTQFGSSSRTIVVPIVVTWSTEYQSASTVCGRIQPERRPVHVLWPQVDPSFQSR